MMNKRVAVLLTDEFEDSEARDPIKALKDEGFEVVVVSPEKGKTYKGKGGEWEVRSDLALKDAKETDFDNLFIPGGHSPENLRKFDEAIEFAKAFMEKGKPVAAICHGPQLLISADCLKGRKATCYETVAVDLKNAGADFEDTEVVVDGNLVTSRKPDDIPAFIDKMKDLFHGNVTAGRR